VPAGSLEKDIAKKQPDISYTQNRELSWLRFNQRVLEEAADTSVPLIERFKFISIFTSNLDEFFMVRVGSLFDLSLITPDVIDNKTLLSPVGQLEQVLKKIPALMSLRDKVYREVSAALRTYGVCDLALSELSREERKYLNHYYHANIEPLLSPQIIDPRHPFPHLMNKVLYVAALLKIENDGSALGIVPVPSSVPDIIRIKDSPPRFIRTENLILQNIQDIFRIYKIGGASIVCVTRNADISFDEEKFDDDSDDYRTHMSLLLKKRNHLAPVRLEIQGEPDHTITEILCGRLGIKKNQVFKSQCPLIMKYVFDLENSLSPSARAEMTYRPVNPRYPECLDPKQSIISQIMRRDALLFYPFEQMTPFIQLLKEACTDPHVVSVKITIYRLASGSQIAQLLCMAAESGKDVTVLMELRARFDEANNIAWAERLEEAGCRIIYGPENFKCHSKICLITRRDHSSISTITQIGTGNYNEKTAAMYTDYCLLTSDEGIGRDAAQFFRNMLIANLNGNYQHLFVAPGGLKTSLFDCIDEEISKGSEGRIIIKANSMTERDVIDKLAEASSAGVHISLILRGICCLLPGIPGKTENIEVMSIVGRFLEHSRVYCFGSGPGAKIYISSADLMTRNITRRVEIACPIVNDCVKEQLLSIIDLQLRDNVKARILLPDGTYQKKDQTSASSIDSQEYFLSHSTQVCVPVSAAQQKQNLFRRLWEHVKFILSWQSARHTI
jgi:polyphosphate kinase